MVSEASFVLALLAVLTLEAEDLLLEDLLVRKAKQELAVELELRRDEQRAFDKLQRILEQLDGKLIL